MFIALPQDSSVAWSMCGWSIKWAPLPDGIAHIEVPWFMRSNGVSVDVIEGVCGAAYRRSFFPDIEILANIHPDCIMTDDMWVSGYLATVSQTRRLLTPGSAFAHWLLEPKDMEMMKYTTEHHHASKIAKKVRGKEYE